MGAYSSCKALVIGVGRYADPQYDLSYARSDAEAIAELLGNEFGFDQVWTLYDNDATRQNLIRFFEQDLQRTDEDDGLLIFFAGHGITVTSAIGDDRGFLVPHDGDPKQPYANLSLTTIRDDYMPMIPAKHVFLIVDSCYGGLALRDVATVERPKSIDDAVLSELTRRDRKVRQVLAAGTKDQRVLDGGLFGHSVFTGRLIEALREANPYITADHVGVHVRERVARDSLDRKHRQTPQFGYLIGSDGSFVFSRSATGMRASTLVAGRCTPQAPPNSGVAREGPGVGAASIGSGESKSGNDAPWTPARAPWWRRIIVPFDRDMDDMARTVARSGFGHRCHMDVDSLECPSEYIGRIKRNWEAKLHTSSQLVAGALIQRGFRLVGTDTNPDTVLRISAFSPYGLLCLEDDAPASTRIGLRVNVSATGELLWTGTVTIRRWTHWLARIGGSSQTASAVPYMASSPPPKISLSKGLSSKEAISISQPDWKEWSKSRFPVSWHWEVGPILMLYMLPLMAIGLPTASVGFATHSVVLCVLIGSLYLLVPWFHIRSYVSLRNRYKLACAEACLKAGDYVSGASVVLSMGRTGVSRDAARAVLQGLARLAYDSGATEYVQQLRKRLSVWEGAIHVKLVSWGRYHLSLRLVLVVCLVLAGTGLAAASLVLATSRYGGQGYLVAAGIIAGTGAVGSAVPVFRILGASLAGSLASDRRRGKQLDEKDYDTAGAELIVQTLFLCLLIGGAAFGLLSLTGWLIGVLGT